MDLESLLKGFDFFTAEIISSGGQLRIIVHSEKFKVGDEVFVIKKPKVKP